MLITFPCPFCMYIYIPHIHTQMEELNRTRAAQRDAANASTYLLSSTSSHGGGPPTARATTSTTTSRFRNRSHNSSNEAAWASTADKLRYSEMERKTKKWLDAKIREVGR